MCNLWENANQLQYNLFQLSPHLSSNFRFLNPNKYAMKKLLFETLYFYPVGDDL